jgi:hypothetical protein
VTDEGKKIGVTPQKLERFRAPWEKLVRGDRQFSSTLMKYKKLFYRGMTLLKKQCRKALRALHVLLALQSFEADRVDRWRKHQEN